MMGLLVCLLLPPSVQMVDNYQNRVRRKKRKRRRRKKNLVPKLACLIYSVDLVEVSLPTKFEENVLSFNERQWWLMENFRIGQSMYFSFWQRVFWKFQIYCSFKYQRGKKCISVFFLAISSILLQFKTELINTINFVSHFIINKVC